MSAGNRSAMLGLVQNVPHSWMTTAGYKRYVCEESSVSRLEASAHDERRARRGRCAFAHPSDGRDKPELGSGCELKTVGSKVTFATSGKHAAEQVHGDDNNTVVGK